MSPKTRKKIFWILFALFILIGSFLVVYSFGYRLDAKSLKFVQTGGLYIKTFPKIGDIHLDKKEVEEKAGILSNGIFIQSLTPGDHQLEISKEGYFGWQKEIEIKPKLVESFSHVILLPQNPAREIFYQTEKGETIFDFFKINDNLYALETRVKDSKGLWQVLKTINSGGEIQEFFKKKISNSGQMGILKNMAFNADFSQIIIPFSRSENKTFYLWDKNNPENLIDLSKALNSLIPSQIKSIRFHPFNIGQYIIHFESILAIWDPNGFSKEKISYLPAENVSSFDISSSKVFWAEKTGLIYYYNLISKSISFLGEIEEGGFKEIDISASPDSQFISAVLDKNLLLTLSDTTNVLLGEKILDREFSPDSRKIAYLQEEDNGGLELRINFLKDLIQDIEKKSGEEVVWELSVPKEKISGFSWLSDSFHLIICAANGQVYFLEIDDRGKINVFSYQFDPGGFVASGSGIIFRVTPNLIEKINLMTPEIEKDAQ